MIRVRALDLVRHIKPGSILFIGAQVRCVECTARKLLRLVDREWVKRHAGGHGTRVAK